MHDISLFANPIAGRGKARNLIHSITDALQHAGHRVRPLLKQATHLTPDELQIVRSSHAIIVIGGDGTLRQVVDKIIHPPHPSPHHPPFLMVPMGTANLMAQYLGLNWNPETVGPQVAQTIAHYKTQQIDAASVSSMSPSPLVGEGRGEGEDSHRQVAPHAHASLPLSPSSPPSSFSLQHSSFSISPSLMLLVAGVGIDAKIVHELTRLRRGPITKLSYAFPAALALSQYTYPKVKVTVDNKKIFHAPGIALIGNVKEYGTGFPVLPHARPDDGLLDICALPCTHPGELLKLFLHSATGHHLEQEGVVYVKGKHITIESPNPLPLQIDGEAAGFTPVQIDLLDTRVKFLIP